MAACQANKLRKNSLVLRLSALTRISTTPALGAPPVLIRGRELLKNSPPDSGGVAPGLLPAVKCFPQAVKPGALSLPCWEKGSPKGRLGTNFMIPADI